MEMELAWLPSPSQNLVMFFFLALLLKRIYDARSYRGSKPKLPPGPWRMPFIGSIHQLVLSGEQTHHRFHSLAKKFGPLFHIKLGQVDFVVASSPTAARAVLNTNDHLLASRPNLLAVETIGYNSTGIGFSPYGPYWRQLRKICSQELLSVQKVRSFRFIRDEEARKLVRGIRMAKGSSPVNLTEMFLSLSNRQITRAAFGMECENREKFLSAMKETIKLLPMLRVVDLFPPLSSLISLLDGSRFKMKRLRREMDLVLDEIIEEHQAKQNAGVKNETEEDLVDVLLRIQQKGDLQIPLTMDNVKAVILDMLVAATETTSNTMCWVMSELMRNPEAMRDVQLEVRKAFEGNKNIEETDIRNLHYLHRVVKETLRVHPPLPLLLPRTSNEATEMLGYTIPAGVRVVVNAWAIARDPTIWDQPETFRPDRFKGMAEQPKFGNNYDYMPFGAGRRMCPGMTFAFAGMEHFLALLLFHFDWEIPRHGSAPQELDMEEEFDGTLRRKRDLCLVAVPRDASFGY
ncbi:hypothetical protein HPP92_024678 [Vanilla planifolia]|uniref:Cytochrome P450 n=1 Tax=Vanilla planifolia TaxID=51239 RepID=A0A835PNE3_VANPL|nr:hypothetical protein HPP92_024678 [Vanilla planifolia]